MSENSVAIGNFTDSVDMAEMLRLFDAFLSHFGCMVRRKYFRPRPANLLFHHRDSFFLLCHIHAVFTVFPSGVDIAVGNGIKFCTGAGGDLFNFTEDTQPTCIFIGKWKPNGGRERPLLYRYETRGIWRGSIIKASLFAIAWGMEEWLIPTVELESSSAGYILPHTRAQILLVHGGVVDSHCVAPSEFKRILKDVLARRTYEAL